MLLEFEMMRVEIKPELLRTPASSANLPTIPRFPSATSRRWTVGGTSSRAFFWRNCTEWS